MISENIEYNSAEIIEIVNNNIITMLTDRGLKINKIKPTNKNNIFIINGETDEEYNIYFSDKITNISINSPIDEFLSNSLIHKILVFKDISKKALNQLLNNFKNFEYFFEHELIENVAEKIFNPKFELLNDYDKNQLLKTFTELELAKIQSTDIMCRYYNGKIGDIFRIIRPSLEAGNNIFYRKVAIGNINNLFQK